MLDGERIEIVLDTVFDSKPAHLNIQINNETVFDSVLESPRSVIGHQHLGESYNIKIQKNGKTLDIVKKNERQQVIVKDVLLNGLGQHPNKFGHFEQKDNPYVKDKIVQTNILNLNGTWRLELPIFRQSFKENTSVEDLVSSGRIRDELSNTVVACFGCSFTHGWGLDRKQTWPHYLGGNTRNYGFGGSTISQIVSIARGYVENYHCEKMVVVLPHPCRLRLTDHMGVQHSLLPGRSPEVEEKFPKVMRDIVLHGEADLILSGHVRELKRSLWEISRRTQLFLSAYDGELYQCLQNIRDESFVLLPPYELSVEHEFARDGEHPGPGHNSQFAQTIASCIY